MIPFDLQVTGAFAYASSEVKNRRANPLHSEGALLHGMGLQAIHDECFGAHV